MQRLLQAALLASVLFLMWVGLLFGFSTGPTPGVNGVFGPTCNQNGCHTGNAVNSPGASISLTGLPSQWTPGQTYPLTISLQRSGAARYGFQFTALSSATTTQAGTFSLPPSEQSSQILCFVGTALVVVNCSNKSAIQYVEHSSPNSSGIFRVNWTAPSTPSGGPVQFNVAVNAANGNGQTSGDFIYTREDVVTPSAITTGVSSQAFAVGELGGTAITTTGSGALTVGYARVQPNIGKTSPAGIEIFGLRQGGVLVSETGVPATPAISTGRLYAEVSGTVNTGVAIANPNSTPASVSFFFTNAAGTDFGFGATIIPANGQIAAFLNQAPFNSGTIQGTFSFTANAPVSVVALRGYVNERSEFLLTTLPVLDTAATLSSSTVLLPHFADGGGWTTQVVLVNPSDSVATGSVQFWGQGSSTVAAAPVRLVVNGQSGTTFNYSIPPRSSFSLTTAGGANPAAAGSLRIVPSAGVAPSALAVFTFRAGGITVSEAGVSEAKASGLRTYAVTTSREAGVGVVQTGIAVANSGSTTNNVQLDLFQRDGTPTGVSASFQVPANGQIAAFLHELFPLNWALPFEGVLRIRTSSGAALSVASLRGRYNERGDFLVTTMPVVDEATPAVTSDTFFPHLANGGGYSTQFVLFSGAMGQDTSGTLRFVEPDGSPLGLNLQ